MTGLSSSVSPLSEVKRKLLERYRSGNLISVEDRSTAITRRPPDAPAPLSLAQEQLWRREQMEGIPPLYNESITIRRNGPLDIPALERSLVEIVRRHEIWRTVYDNSNGRPFQVIQPAPRSFPLQIIDLREHAKPDLDAEILRLTTAETARRFDLTQGPLLRATLFRLNNEEYRLFIAAHLSIIDGISVYQVLPAELSALYASFTVDEPSPLAEPCIQYADYAYWQRTTFSAAERTEQWTYWREKLGGELPILQWPAGASRSASPSYRGAIRPFTVSAELERALRDLGRREGVTLFAVLVASFCTLVHCYTREIDLIIGTPSPAGRKRPETQKLLGYFLNPIALRIDLQGDPAFRELLLRVQNVVATAMCYDDVPLEVLAEELQPRFSPSLNPFFKTAISLQPRTPAAAAGWEVTSMDANSGGAPWDLYLAFIESANSMLGRIQYNPEVFKPGAVTALSNDLQRLMTAVTDDPGQQLSTALRRF